MITGQTKISKAMALLNPFAKENNLRLSTWKDFKEVAVKYNKSIK